VANDLKVKLSGAPRDDTDIARAVAHVLEWNVQVQAVIEDAFKREAEIDARHIRVEVSDHTAKLYGHVHSLHEASAARAAAAAAPGVATVESHLVVSP